MLKHGELVGADQPCGIGPTPPPVFLNERPVYFRATPYAALAARRPPRRTRVLRPRECEALSAFNALGGGIDADFTASDLRRAFRRLARQYHPDRHPGQNTQAYSHMFA